MTDIAWYTRNLQAIEARLAPVKAARDGVLYHNAQSGNDIMVFKEEGVVMLYFHAALDAEVQSRMVLDKPVHLLSPYSQIALLSLLWQPEPKRVYVIGFGGGRIPMVLHHFLPQCRVDCAEIDREVVDVATRFFGAAKDKRLHIAIQDGRKALAQHSAEEPYDIIVVDAFLGLGQGPRAFSTMEFFALCRSKLSPAGLVVANLLDRDPANAQKRETMIQSFPRVLAVRDEDRGNWVLFGCNNGEADLGDVVSRAGALEERLHFSTPLVAHAQKLQVLASAASPLQLRRLAVLRDEAAVAAAPGLGRNDPCSCGSGKKYKKCHG
jgi:spermidine synthase